MARHRRRTLIGAFVLVFNIIPYSATAEYCIQAVSAPLSRQASLIEQARRLERSGLPARVERREPFAVVRIGDFATYREAKSLYRRVHEKLPGAYIRRCEIRREALLYPLPSPDETSPPPKHSQTAAPPSEAQDILALLRRDRDAAMWERCAPCLRPELWRETGTKSPQRQRCERKCFHTEEETHRP